MLGFLLYWLKKAAEKLEYLYNWMVHFFHDALEQRPGKGVFFVALAAVLLLGSFASLPSALAMVTNKQVDLQIDGKALHVGTDAQTVAELIGAVDIEIAEGTVIYPELSHRLQNGDSIRLKSAMRVTVVADGKEKRLAMIAGPVRQALLLAGVSLNENDEVSPPLDAQVSNGLRIEVFRVRVYIETQEKGIPYQTVYQEDSSLYTGNEETKRQGSDGVKQLQIRVTEREGEEVERTLLREEILVPAQNRLIARGVKARPTPTPKPTKTPKSSAKASAAPSASKSAAPKVTPDPNKKNASDSGSGTITVDGKTYQYSEKLSMELTAYTHTGQKTATGTWPDIGTLAIDPSVIPYGTKLFVEGYGFGVARDCGVSGLRVDVFLNTEAECRSFGRRRDKAVYILE
ncbi:MAG: G5 domain-containing protein [Christensenellaceae bacterium]|nr:G5 domain-containing protein [Christensenellaceae bacterium]